MKTDIHQHLWTEPLVEALSRRRELPFVRHEHGLTVLFLAGEQPYVIDLDGEAPSARAELVERDGLDRALVCLSSPLGIESLPRASAVELIDAYHEGALALGEPFGVWGALALDQLDPDDVDRALDRGCVGISLPAGALASVEMLARLSPALARIQDLGAPLFVHPGRGARLPTYEAIARRPAVVAGARPTTSPRCTPPGFVFATAARRPFPDLRVMFAMLAGLAPLHAERLIARGGPEDRERDPLIFYDTSSYGPRAVNTMAHVSSAPSSCCTARTARWSIRRAACATRLAAHTLGRIPTDTGRQASGAAGSTGRCSRVPPSAPSRAKRRPPSRGWPSPSACP